MCTAPCQTDLTLEDINKLQKYAATAAMQLPPPSSHTAEIIGNVLDSDQRVTFYTGIPTNSYWVCTNSYWVLKLCFLNF